MKNKGPWVFAHRVINGWGCNGLFDEKGTFILGDGPGWSSGLVMPSKKFRRMIELAPLAWGLLDQLRRVDISNTEDVGNIVKEVEHLFSRLPQKSKR